jgi:hypothetical protein
MGTYAVVKDCLVSNLIEWDGEDSSWMTDKSEALIEVLDGHTAEIGMPYSEPLEDTEK